MGIDCAAFKYGLPAIQFIQATQLLPLLHLQSSAMRIFGLVSLFVAISHVLADPFSGDLNVLLLGNKAFRDTMAATEPGFLQDLADAKHCMNHLPFNIACRILNQSNL